MADTLDHSQVMLLKTSLRKFAIETPSWAYGNTGTRFHVFAWPGAARNIWEKIADAAIVHQFTGICPTVAIHIPWDRVEDWGALRDYAHELGIRIGTVNPNLFQDDEYRLGSLCHPNSVVRQRAIAHILECIEIAQAVGSTAISLWLPDGTNYPGQDNFRSRKRRLLESLSTVYDHLPDGMRLLIEYKFFEPAFYHTDLADWGMAYVMANYLGPKAQLLVDLGHHPQGTNVEHIVAFLLDEGRLGGFHFNDRKYADDDLITGSSNPFQLFLILNEIVAALADPMVASNAQNIAYMIDQSHNIESKIEGMIQSVLAIQTAYIKALLVNRSQLREAQEIGDILGAYRILLGAYETDVRPLLREWWREIGVDPDPITAFRESGYAEKIVREREV